MAKKALDGLTIRQKKFVEEYLRNGMNASAAALYAGYSKKTAAFIGHENLNKPKIKKHIQKRVGQLLAAQDLATLKAFSQLQAIADFDIRKVIQWDASGVRMKPSHTIDDRTAYAIREIEVTETISQGQASDDDGWPEERVARKIKVKSEKKLKAIELIGKYLGMFEGGPEKEQLQEDEKVLSPSSRMELIAQLHQSLYEQKSPVLIEEEENDD